MVQRMFDNSRIDSLTIHLDGKVPRDPTTGCPVFHPLQFITGKVVWTTRTPKAADNVVMVFRGWSKTRVAKLDSPKSTKRSAHSEEMTLFRLESKLDKGPRTFEPGTYEWPFQWVFPQRANAYVTRSYGDVDNTMFRNRPHDLPPTMISEGAPWDSAEVCYQLEVKVNTNNYHDVAQCLPLILVTHLKDPLPEITNSFTCLGIDQWKSKKLRTEKFTMSEKVVLLCKRATVLLEAPVLKVSATVSMPSVASIWQPWPLLLSLQQIRDDVNDPDRPQMCIYQIRLELVAHLDIRASTPQGNYSTSLAYHVGVLRIPACQVPEIKLDNQLVVVKHDVRLGEFLAQEGMNMVPDFKSYIINHRHKIRVQVAVMHCQTGHIFHFETVNSFQIFPAPETKSEAISKEELARWLEMKKESDM